MTKSIPTNIEDIKEKVRTLVKEARLAGGGNTYADDSLSLYESDVYQALDELIISAKIEELELECERLGGRPLYIKDRIDQLKARKGK